MIADIQTDDSAKAWFFRPKYEKELITIERKLKFYKAKFHKRNGLEWDKWKELMRYNDGYKELFEEEDEVALDVGD